MKLFKNNQYGRNLLTECSADEQIFSSDVYKQNTRARKYQSDVPQYGRSMVEMLGVLAIIGVLSVGAIAGYSKAMFKYKINKQQSQLNTVLNLMSRDKEIWKQNQSSMLDYYITTNEIPKEMIQKNKTVKDVFGNSLVFSSNVGEGVMRSLLNLSIAKGTNFDLCANVINTAKEQSSNIYFFSLSVSSKPVISYYGDNYANGTNNLRTKTLADYEPYCQQCKEKGCLMQFMWHLGKYI